MRQFQFGYKNKNALKKELGKIKQWCSRKVTSAVVFHIFAQLSDKKVIDEICSVIDTEMPDAMYVGCSTNGNISDGRISEYVVSITCTVWEFPSTVVETLQFKLTTETEKEVTRQIVEKVNSSPWVKSVEMLVTIRGMSMTDFCDDLNEIRDGVEIYGGGAFNQDINNESTFVFSKNGDFSHTSVAFVLVGGDDLYIETDYVTGWKPLGREFHVTKADKSTLYELDGKPAYDAYYRYLNIKNDENFFSNTLEFPFFYEHNGIIILRAPISANDDGSLTMTSDMDENVSARIAYGDPWTILESVHRGAQKMADFSPEVIRVFSCAARRTFWGVEEISKETMPFQSLAPTSGFYTSGEFLRTDGYVNQHNVTLVIAAMREGEPVENKISPVIASEHFSGKVSMINRLATFIEAATQELEEANRKLETIAITDGLTKLYNRVEIQRRITSALEKKHNFSLIMLDIDNFKQVNDVYGHQEGDNVIIGLSKLLKEYNIRGYKAGRWGGEEFMMLLSGENIEKAAEIAEELRVKFSKTEFRLAGCRTVSIGVTQMKENDDADTLFIRVDNALYEAKGSGKNKVVII